MYMKTLIEQINTAFRAFEADANAQAAKGNKAAGTRARKTSLQIAKMLKAFREQSVKFTA
jgi:hypothetical protein